MTAPTRPALETAAQVAARLGLSVWSVYHHARTGALPSKRLGRSIRFIPSEVDAAVAALPPGGPA